MLRLALMLLSLLAVALPAAGQGPQEDAFWYGTGADGQPTVRLHFFWSATCPHCVAAQPFVASLPARLPWVEIGSHDISADREAVGLYLQAARATGGQARSVPGFLFCRQMHVGFHSEQTTGAEFLRLLQVCHAARQEATAADPAIGVMPEPGAPPASAAAAPVNAPPPHDEPGHGANGQAQVEPVVASLPVLGTVDLQRWSLPVLTVVLAALDAFNPCAFFVLLFLLSLLVHAKSRLRMLFIGGVFVLASGLVYFAFMAAWLNLFLLMGELRGVTLVAGLVAVLVAAINIKDYFRLGLGPSLSIPASAKPGLFRRMREVVSGDAMAPMVAGTVLLALVANSYELLCTAGFPMVFARALTLHDLGPAGYYAYLALYNTVYVIPLALIVLAFTFTLGRRKLSEREGRLLKLVSGYMMLGLGLLLVFAPRFLTHVGAAVAVAALALLMSVVTARLTPTAAKPRHDANG